MDSRRSLFRFLLPLLSALFAVVLVELVLIAFYPIPYSLERNMYFEPDPHTGYRHRPLAVGTYPNHVPAKANSLGFRDDEATLEKTPGTFRILMLGDSFTVGANVEQPDVYPQVLERLLNTSSAQRIEVLNAGVGGFEPFHYAAFVENYADNYDPDMLLLGLFVGNDTYSPVQSVEQTRTAVLGRRVTRDVAKGDWSWSIVLKVWGYENLNVVRALVNHGPSGIEFVRSRCDQFSRILIAVQEKRMRNHLADPEADQQENMATNMNHLDRIQAFATKRNIPFVVVLLPDENQLNSALQALVIPDVDRDKYDFEMPQKALRASLDQADIPYLDLLADFRADTRCLYMNDTHWIAAGHAMAAERIRDGLVRKALLP